MTQAHAKNRILVVALLASALIPAPASAADDWGEPEMPTHGAPAAVAGKPAPPPGSGVIGPPPGGHVWEWPKDTSITQSRHGWAVFHALEIFSALLLMFGGTAWVWMVRYDRRRTRRLQSELRALQAERGSAS